MSFLLLDFPTDRPAVKIVIMENNRIHYTIYLFNFKALKFYI